ncbi:MAG: hypothetical protein LBS42_04250, partial [Tannerella sp.]|nr:hypothetical protein [Tannerella sp.]
MKKIERFITLTVLAFAMAVPALAQNSEALWIWHPGDFELWLSSKIQVERTERGMFYPPFWRMDRHTPLV